MYFLAMYYESVCEAVLCLEPTMTVISEKQQRKLEWEKAHNWIKNAYKILLYAAIAAKALTYPFKRR